MRHPSPLPGDLPVSFSVAEARARGVTPDRLRRSDLAAPYRGLRTRLDGPASPQTTAGACAILVPRLTPAQFFSHETALALVGAPMPDWPYVPRIHVSAHRPAREPRVPGICGHRLQAREPAVLWAGAGIPLEHPVRAWRQCATLWALDDLIAAADFLVSGDRPWATPEELSAEVAAMGDVGGVLRRALRDCRAGVRSSRETRLRLLLVRAGLPEPLINWTLHDDGGRFVAELDLAYPGYRVGVEYDGRVHAEDPRQFAKDADRWDRIRAESWTHVRILNHHLAGAGVAAVRKVRDALRIAGWRPGQI